MTLKRLDEIADVFSGVRSSRYAQEDGVKTKIFVGKPSKSPEWEYQTISPHLNEKFYSKENDIIIHLSNVFAVERITKEGIVIPMQYAVIRLNEGYDSKYVYHILKSKDFKRKLERFQMGSALKFIKINDLKSIKIAIPDIDTQKKYSELFELVDLKIQLKNKEINLISDFKDILIETGEKHG